MTCDDLESSPSATYRFDEPEAVAYFSNIHRAVQLQAVTNVFKAHGLNCQRVSMRVALGRSSSAFVSSQGRS